MKSVIDLFREFRFNDFVFVRQFHDLWSDSRPNESTLDFHCEGWVWRVWVAIVVRGSVTYEVHAFHFTGNVLFWT